MNHHLPNFWFLEKSFQLIIFQYIYFAQKSKENQQMKKTYLLQG